VLSADTLIYFADQHEVVQATHASLRPGGILAITLEVLDGDGDRVELHPSGRYQHSRRHVLQALEAAGFGEVQMAAHPLRKELGRPVSGWVVLARRGN
jgi:predicted TPR repeat methyltransferase